MIIVLVSRLGSIFIYRSTKVLCRSLPQPPPPPQSVPKTISLGVAPVAVTPSGHHTVLVVTTNFVRTRIHTCIDPYTRNWAIRISRWLNMT